MRIFGERLGRAGAAILVLATVVAIVLGLRGYRAPGLAGLGTVSTAGTATGPTGPTGPSAAGPTAAPTSSKAGTTSKAKPGPLLSQSPYAPYAFEIYPGALSQNARLALAGFAFSARPEGGGFQLTLTVKGSSQAPIRHTYPNGDRVYFVEANLGDDAGASEYNFGDDGLVVTDAQGRIVG